MSNLATCQNDPSAAESLNTRTPEYRVSNRENGYTLSVNLPGAEKDAIAIAVEKRVITVNATRADTTVGLGKRIHSESQADAYKLALRLGRDVDASNIEASYENGVLSLNISKSIEAQARKIAVN